MSPGSLKYNEYDASGSTMVQGICWILIAPNVILWLKNLQPDENLKLGGERLEREIPL